MTLILEYTGIDGVPRKVVLPNGANPAYAEEGIPYSLDVSELYEPAFAARLTRELWALNLVQPSDYLKPGAADKISRALAAARRADTFDIQALARRTDNGGK